MGHEKVYVTCENMCMEEGLTKKQIEDKFKDSVVVIKGAKTLNQATTSGTYEDTSWMIEYPEGFNQRNTIVLSYAGTINDYSRIGAYGHIGMISGDSLMGTLPRAVALMEDKINLHACNSSETSKTWYYTLVLMKEPEYVEGVDYKLGDVDGDGIITQNDADLVQKYIMGEITFSDKQFKAADWDKDGRVRATDRQNIINHIGQ